MEERKIDDINSLIVIHVDYCRTVSRKIAKYHTVHILLSDFHQISSVLFEIAYSCYSINLNLDCQDLALILCSYFNYLKDFEENLS